MPLPCRVAGVREGSHVVQGSKRHLSPSDASHRESIFAAFYDCILTLRGVADLGNDD